VKIKLNRILLSAAAAGALLIAGGAQAASLLSDGGFESPNLGNTNYTYPGSVGAWSFNGASLINAASTSAWYGGSGPAGKEGVQFAGLQGGSSITQSFTADASTLHLGWLSAGRACCSGANDQTYQVTLNGAAVSGVMSTVGGSDFSFNMLTLSGLTASTSYTLGFQGLAGSDKTSFIDNVVLQDSIFPPAPVAPQITVLSNLANTDPGIPGDQHVVDNFTDPVASGYSFSGGYVRSGALGLDSGVSAPPPGDLTNYETVTAGQHATLTSNDPMKSFSFFLGSPDSYNMVQFYGPGGYNWTLSGDAIWGGNPPGNGDQSIGKRIRYDFGANPVDKIVFSSSGNSFEFDTLAAHSGGVPEPAAWGLMILGFGGIGAVLRRRRQTLPAVTA
jgi:hypothetical protein